MLGWLAGRTVAVYIEAYDHWVAFVEGKAISIVSGDGGLGEGVPFQKGGRFL